MTRKINQRSDCPVSFALDIFGDKWSLLIIRDLLFSGKYTYGDFLSSNEKMATNILANRLQQLEAADIVIKEDSGKKSKYIYSLTDKGKDLLPLLLEIIRWSSEHHPPCSAPKRFVSRIKKDKEELMKEVFFCVDHNCSVMDKYPSSKK